MIKKETILITGGAGYLGSACVKALINKKGNNYNIIIIDNLSKGKKELINNRATFYNVDLIDMKKTEEVFTKHKIDSIIHFAGYKAADESMKDAIKYSNNITGTINLLNCMIKHKVKRIIYSSSAALYGTVEKSPITEKEEVSAINFYGYTKLANEQIIEWYSKIYNLSYLNLRYFNIVGDAGFGYIDPEAQNVLPIIMEVVIGKRDQFIIAGDDYPTRDGTGIRDYIDINDMIDAHILALESNYNGTLNLGSSNGTSVKELIEMTEEIIGEKIPYYIGPRRDGDIASSIASNKMAEKILKWKPKIDIRTSIKTTYKVYTE